MIIRLEEAKYKLQGLEEAVKELGSALKIEKLRENAKTLEEKPLKQTSGTIRKSPELRFRNSSAQRIR